MGSKVGMGQMGPQIKQATKIRMGTIDGYGADFTNPSRLGNKKRNQTETPVEENFGSVSSVSTIRKNRGLLSNSMSDTLG